MSCLMTSATRQIGCRCHLDVGVIWDLPHHDTQDNILLCRRNHFPDRFLKSAMHKLRDRGLCVNPT
jgi:hypothetical protein